MQFEMQHPVDPTVQATYGWDRAVGFFVTIRSRSQRVEYDNMRPGYDHVRGALALMARFGFFEEEDIELARMHLAVSMPGEIEDDAGIRRCAQVLVDMQRAAD